jgi:hypothetical protein
MTVVVDLGPMRLVDEVLVSRLAALGCASYINVCGADWRVAVDVADEITNLLCREVA